MILILPLTLPGICAELTQNLAAPGLSTDHARTRLTTSQSHF